MEGPASPVYDDGTFARGFLLFLAACSAVEPPPSPRLPAASSATPASPSPERVESTTVAMPEPPSPFPPGPPFIPEEPTLVTGMPAFAEVLAAAKRGELSRAEAELARLGASEDPQTMTLAWYALAVTALDRQAFAVATRAAERARASDTPLRPYAALVGAEAALGAGDLEDARRHLTAAEPSVDARVWDGLALRLAVASRKTDDVLTILERIVTRKDPGHRLLVLKHGRAGLVPPDVTRASRVARLAQRAFLGAPSGRGAEEAKKLLDFALGHLDRTTKAELLRAAPFDAVTVATELLATNRAKEALRLLERAPETCQTLRLTADALGKVKRTSEAATTYGEAVDACANEPDAVIPVLFAAGRAAARGGLLDKADAWLARIETIDPKHRLADDARLEAALAAKKRGDVARFDALLARVDEEMPAGDVVGDALFELGLTRLEAGDDTRALEAFTRGARRGLETTYTRTGRFTYFAGKTALRLGKIAEAKASFVATLRARPHGYYGALAYASLERIAQGEGQGAMAALRRDSELERARMIAPEPVFGALPWLVRASDGPRALAEANRLGVESHTAHPFVIALSARSIGRIDPARAHRFLRTADELEQTSGRNEVRAHFAVPPEGAALPLYRAAYPSPFTAASEAAAGAAGLDLAWVQAITREESAFDPDAVSRANAYGLMQLLVPTATKLAGKSVKPADLKKPEQNLALGAKFLAQLFRRYPGGRALAVAAYNAGPGNVDDWCAERPGADLDLWAERIPFSETRAYVKRVLGSYAVYAGLAHGHLGDLRGPGVGACPVAEKN